MQWLCIMIISLHPVPFWPVCSVWRSGLTQSWSINWEVIQERSFHILIASPRELGRVDRHFQIEINNRGTRTLLLTCYRSGRSPDSLPNLGATRHLRIWSWELWKPWTPNSELSILPTPFQLLSRKRVTSEKTQLSERLGLNGHRHWYSVKEVSLRETGLRPPPGYFHAIRTHSEQYWETKEQISWRAERRTQHYCGVETRKRHEPKAGPLHHHVS